MTAHALVRALHLAREHRRALQVVAGVLAGIGFLLALTPPLATFATPVGLGLAALGVVAGVGLDYAGVDDEALFESPVEVALVVVGVVTVAGLLYAVVGVVAATFVAGVLAGGIAAK